MLLNKEADRTLSNSPPRLMLQCKERCYLTKCRKQKVSGKVGLASSIKFATKTSSWQWQRWSCWLNCCSFSYFHFSYYLPYFHFSYYLPYFHFSYYLPYFHFSYYLPYFHCYFTDNWRKLRTRFSRYCRRRRVTSLKMRRPLKCCLHPKC